jgi:hypothetical protein
LIFLVILRKLHCFNGLHWSPLPQWHTGLMPSSLARAGGLWQPMPAERGQGDSRAHAVRGPCAPVRSHRGWRQTWCGARCCGAASSATWSSAKPPPLLQLHAAILRPRQGGRKRGAHRRGGRAAAIDGVEGGNGSQVGEGAPGSAS